MELKKISRSAVSFFIPVNGPDMSPPDSQASKRILKGVRHVEISDQYQQG
jgi:hypothetical protein